MIRPSIGGLLRPWRDKAFQLLALALGTAGFTLATVILLHAELEQRFSVRTAEMLGGELVLTGTQEPTTEQHALLSERDTSQVVDFSTVLTFGDELLLVSARAVDDYYPLYGKIQVAGSRFDTARSATKGPAPGELWVADQVLDRLGTKLGEHLTIGRKRLLLTAIIRQLPDQSAGFYSMSPRVVFNHHDLVATGVLGPGTRIRHLQMISGNADIITDLQNELDATLRPDQRLEDIKTAAVRSMGPLRQLTLWSNLAVLLISLLCGATIYLATVERVSKRARMAGLLRSFGARRRQIISRLLGAEFFAVLPASVLGSLLGIASIAALHRILAWQGPLTATITQWLTIFASPVLLWLAFSLPRLSALVRMPAMEILHERGSRQALSTNIELAAALAAPVLLAGLLTSSLSELGNLLGLLVILGAGLPALLSPLLKGLDLVSGKLPLAFRLALRRLSRRPSLTLPLLAALTLAMAILALAGQTGNQLLDDWRSRLPQQAPNHFVLNMFDKDFVTFDRWLAKHQAITQPLYPIVRGRLIEINGEPVSRAVTKEREKNNEALNRDLALTEAADMLASNKINSGTWHPTANTVSVEQELADRLGLKLGDKLLFITSRGSITSEIASLRKVDWDTFEPNFYFMFAPGGLADQDITWLTGFWLPSGDGKRLAELMQLLPHITLLDVNTLLEKANEIIGQASAATALLAVLLILAAVLVLAAALLGGQAQRGRDNALLRALGGNNALLHKVTWAEFMVLCGCAAVAATIVIFSALYPLTAQLLNDAPSLSYWQIIPLLIGICVACVGVLASRGAMNKSALSLLRDES
jgi:putative ABC transport system permease protein